jgi:hypothetical protein
MGSRRLAASNDLRLHPLSQDANGGAAGAPDAAAAAAPDAAAAAAPASAAAAAANPAPAASPKSALTADDAVTVAYRGVQLVQLLVQHKPEWLPAQAGVFRALCERWTANCAAKVGTWCRAVVCWGGGGALRWRRLLLLLLLLLLLRVAARAEGAADHACCHALAAPPTTHATTSTPTPTTQRPMAGEVLLSQPALLEAQAVARCLLAYLSSHHELVEPVLDLFDFMGVRHANHVISASAVDVVQAGEPHPAHERAPLGANHLAQRRLCAAVCRTHLQQTHPQPTSTARAWTWRWCRATSARPSRRATRWRSRRRSSSRGRAASRPSAAAHPRRARRRSRLLLLALLVRVVLAAPPPARQTPTSSQRVRRARVLGVCAPGRLQLARPRQCASSGRQPPRSHQHNAATH